MMMIWRGSVGAVAGFLARTRRRDSEARTGAKIDQFPIAFDSIRFDSIDAVWCCVWESIARRLRCHHMGPLCCCSRILLGCVVVLRRRGGTRTDESLEVPSCGGQPCRHTHGVQGCPSGAAAPAPGRTVGRSMISGGRSSRLSDARGALNASKSKHRPPRRM